MVLYDEEQRRNEEKRSKKIKKFVISAIIISFIVIVGLIVAIFYLTNNPNRIVVNLNGKSSTDLEKILSVEADENGNISIYAPIKEIAKYFEYSAYNGEYSMVSESTDSCYVENEDEVAVFNLDSNIIYKIDKTVSNAEYESCMISKPVFQKDGILYVNDEGLENAFNLNIAYNVKKKVINLYTMSYRVTKASTSLSNGEEIDDSLANRKAILEDIMVYINSDGQYGVKQLSTGDRILDSKYDNISYIPHKNAFIIEKNNKAGIITVDGITKISPEYDELTLIDSSNELYLAKKDGLYGVINIEGKVVIYIEYSKIGMSISDFKQNGIKFGYVLCNKLIPVQQNGKWGFYDITGHQVTDLKYETIGCKTSTNKGVNYNLLVVPDYNAIVVKRDGKYTFINLDGEELLSCVFKDMYIAVSSGKEEYYMIWYDQNAGIDKKYVITDYLKK